MLPYIPMYGNGTRISKHWRNAVSKRCVCSRSQSAETARRQVARQTVSRADSSPPPASPRGRTRPGKALHYPTSACAITRAMSGRSCGRCAGARNARSAKPASATKRPLEVQEVAAIKKKQDRRFFIAGLSQKPHPAGRRAGRLFSREALDFRLARRVGGHAGGAGPGTLAGASQRIARLAPVNQYIWAWKQHELPSLSEGLLGTRRTAKRCAAANRA